MKKDVVLKIVILLMSYSLMADNVVVPIVPNIFGAFPDASPFLQNFLVSGGMMIAIPATLIFGKLAQYISKKYLLIFAYAVSAVAGMGMFFSDSVYIFAVFRGCMGIALGFLGAGCFSLIADLFQGERERSGMMGLYNASMAVMGITMATSSGYIALINWHYSFLLHIGAIVIAILMAIVLPATPPERKSPEAGKPVEKRRPPYLRVAALSVSTIFCNMLFMILFYFIAVYLQEANIGDSSTAGIMSSIGTVGGFIAGLVFAVLYARVKRFTPALFFLVIGACYVVLSMNVNLVIVAIACFLANWAYNLSMSYYYLKATMLVPSSVVSLSAAVTNASIAIGCALAPFAYDVYQAVLKASTLKGIFPYVAITLGICGVLSIILAKREKK